jgi:hypothetical protein
MFFFIILSNRMMKENALQRTEEELQRKILAKPLSYGRSDGPAFNVEFAFG